MIHPSTPGAGDREGGEPLAKTLGGAARLLPCPFCGGTPEHDALMIGEAGKDNAEPHGHFVECQTCLAMSGSCESPAEAAEAWNRRYSPEAEGLPEASSPKGPLPATPEVTP